MHEWVIRAGLLREDGNTHRVFMRLEHNAPFGRSAVLDTSWSRAYHYLGNGCAYIMSNADTIVQIENAGTADERSLPEGQGSGYLWSANMYTRLLEQDNGTYVEFQTLGLSRSIPWLYGWLVWPFTRRVGRGSVEQTLLELRQELLARQGEVRSPRGAARLRTGFAQHSGATLASFDVLWPAHPQPLRAPRRWFRVRTSDSLVAWSSY